MKSTTLLFVAGLLSLIVHCSLQDVDETPRIAIIGAGITGASAAYHLHLASPSNASITIFESDSRVGGKVASLPIPDTNNRTFFETGAPHFFTDDRCLVQAAEELDLHLKDNRFAAYGEDGPYHWRKPSGVWDGEKITGTPSLILHLRLWLDVFGLTSLMDPVRIRPWNSFWDNLRALWLGQLELDSRLQASCNLEYPSWWSRIHMRWEYGLSPVRFRLAAHGVVRRWNAFGSEVYIGFNDDFMTQSGTDYLTSIHISERFQIEVIQPCVRARYAQNLADVRGLDAIMACRESKETSIREGNVRLVERTITSSKATLQLNTKVIRIEHGRSRRYKLSVTHDLEHAVSTEHNEFDVVMLAGSIHDPNLQDSLRRLDTHHKQRLTHQPTSQHT
jgi:hypothetical protein